MPYPKAAAGLNLTDEEEKAVIDTWTVLAQDLRGAGVRFFVYFFGVHPKYQPMFPGFGKLPLEELAENKRFQAHGYTVMNTIDGFLQSTDDIDFLKELLTKTGSNHAKIKLTAEDFEVVQSSLMVFFENEWGDAFTPIVAHSWAKVLTAVVGIIVEGLEAYNKAKSADS